MWADDLWFCAACIGCLHSLCKFCHAQLHHSVLWDRIVIDILSNAIHHRLQPQWTSLQMTSLVWPAGKLFSSRNLVFLICHLTTKCAPHAVFVLPNWPNREHTKDTNVPCLEHGWSCTLYIAVKPIDRPHNDIATHAIGMWPFVYCADALHRDASRGMS